MSLSTKQIKDWTRRMLVSSLGHLILGLITVSCFVRVKLFSQLVVFIEFWLLSIGSLYFLTRLAADLIRLMSANDEAKVDFTMGTMIWGFLKFITLGVTIWRMTQTSEEFGLALALGVGTLFMVPMSSALMHKWKRI